MTNLARDRVVIDLENYSQHQEQDEARAIKLEECRPRIQEIAKRMTYESIRNQDDVFMDAVHGNLGMSDNNFSGYGKHNYTTIKDGLLCLESDKVNREINHGGFGILWERLIIDQMMAYYMKPAEVEFLSQRS